MLNIYFSDSVQVSADDVDNYGAFNVSLIGDLPLFIDPFLLFNSRLPKYRQLHDQIIQYVRFLRDKAVEGGVTPGLLKAWYMFPEVKQTWLGYSLTGNKGRGLGPDFGKALNRNLNTIFASFGSEKVAHGSHLEKLCLIKDGVGKDNISDFATNLIKDFLLDYTQEFARSTVGPDFRRVLTVNKVRFNYDTESWEDDRFELPYVNGDYVLLIPKDILTKDDVWINKSDLLNDYEQIASGVPNNQLRQQIGNYFEKVLPKEPTRKEVNAAIAKVYQEFPELIEYYIRFKEENGQSAQALSDLKVSESERLYVRQVVEFAAALQKATGFYSVQGNTYDEARARVKFLKDVIENKGGYRIFYLDGKPIGREEDAQILFRLTWFATPSDVSREVNDGRGPVDFKISRGSSDKALVEFKLASNTQLRKNLENQVEIYKKASDAERAIKVIVFFSDAQRERAMAILRDLGIEKSPDIVLIDARADNKPSASKATSH
jgi:hypothetical protein